MTIRDEAPEIFRKLKELASLYKASNDAAGDMDAEQFMESIKENVELWQRLKIVDELVGEVLSDIASHSLSDNAKKRFTDAVSEYLNGHSLLRVHLVGPGRSSLGFRETPGEWFDVRVFKSGGALDGSVYFSIIHPALLTEAKKRWGENLRVHFDTPPPSGSYEDERQAVFRKYGISEDTSTWMWAYEALSIAERAKQLMNLRFRLSDFVVWTCTDEPGNMGLGAEFGEPEFYHEATFGQRIEHPDYVRIEGCKIWKIREGTYVSPLWEYLGWRAESYAGVEEYARNLAGIGEGLDAAVLSFDPSADPDDVHRVRLTSTRIFRAGEAVTKLRVKLDLEDMTLKGMRAESAEKARAEKGGKASASARAARRAALLDALETLIRDNPVLARLDPKVAASEALRECIASEPALWSQGRGQIDEYLGEIRRGEAGVALQARFLALFPKGTAQAVSRQTPCA